VIGKNIFLYSKIYLSKFKIQFNKMSNFPLVSFIIPTYNSEKTIIRCLKSVSNQTYPNIEIIIIDDFSDDNTILRILDLNLKNLTLIKKKKNFGPSKCRNEGILASKGEYISILDSDDYIFPHKTEKQINFLRHNREYSIIGSNVIINDNKREIFSIRKNSHDEIIRSIFYYNPFCHSSIIFKKKDFLQTDMYNENISFGEDHRLVSKLLTIGKGYNVQEYLVKKYEIFGESISRKTKKSKLIYCLFTNRIYIFNVLKKNKLSFTFAKSILSLLFIFLVYTFSIDKEKIRSLINDKKYFEYI